MSSSRITLYAPSSPLGLGGVGGVKPARFVSQERDARQQYTIFKEGGPGYTKYVVYTADNSDRK